MGPDLPVVTARIHRDLIIDVLRALAGGTDLDDTLQLCAQALVNHLDAAFARIWILDEDEQVLELRSSAGMYTHRDGAHARVPVGALKIGMIAAEHAPHLTNEVRSDPRISDPEWARREGMVAFAGYPLMSGERLVGVMAMFARHALTSEALLALASVADFVALGIERRRAEEQLRETALDNARLYEAAQKEIEKRRRTEEIQRFLAEASMVLASALEYPEGYERLARLAVPFLADLCLIDVAEADGIRRVAAAHADPARAELVRELSRYEPDLAGEHPAARVIRTGRAERSPEMAADFLRTTTRGPDHLRIVRALGFTSYVCVPLAARRRTLGAFTLVSAGSGRRFGEADMAIAADLANRAALALDNSRLLAERTHVARTLQASLLPPSLPEIPGVEVAARYRAAGEGNEVGGDFYDLFEVGEASWILVVGDVCGKGPEAAAVTGLARHTLRAAAVGCREPVELLRWLNGALLRDATESRSERFATVCCGLLEAVGGGLRLTVASGGHPLPLVVRAGGGVESPACAGSLLGAFEEVELNAAQVDLAAGDAVVIFTDGVTERHAEAEELGEKGLASLLGAARGSAAVMAQTVLDAVLDSGPDEPQDDLAVVVLRVRQQL
ncbi:MAG: SpoIIE family protein phosphatase [Acidimicrobiales bacterium]